MSYSENGGATMTMPVAPVGDYGVNEENRPHSF